MPLEIQHYINDGGAFAFRNLGMLQFKNIMIYYKESEDEQIQEERVSMGWKVCKNKTSGEIEWKFAD